MNNTDDFPLPMDDSDSDDVLNIRANCIELENQQVPIGVGEASDQWLNIMICEIQSRDICFRLLEQLHFKSKNHVR